MPSAAGLAGLRSPVLGVEPEESRRGRGFLAHGRGRSVRDDDHAGSHTLCHETAERALLADRVIFGDDQRREIHNIGGVYNPNTILSRIYR